MTRPDALKASSARIYDYFLGGRDHYAIDREAGDALLAAVSDVRDGARATRGFVLRAARYIAEQGITQFLDIGAGIPTKPNVHEIVRSVHPQARVAYVDNDPIAVAKGEALRDQPGVATVAGDLRTPAAIFKDSEVAGLLDLSEPIGVLTVAVWHFVPEDDATRYQALLRDALAAGSFLALSHACTEKLSAAEIKAGEALYRQTTNPVRARTRAQVAALLDGFDIVDPGLVSLHEWHPRAGDPYPEESSAALAGVGVLR